MPFGAKSTQWRVGRKAKIEVRDEATNPLPGALAYSVVSESFGNNVCTRTTEITTPPDGGKPKVVSQTSGNCNESPGGALTVSPSTPSGAKSIAVHSAIQTSSAPRTAL